MRAKMRFPLAAALALVLVLAGAPTPGATPPALGAPVQAEGWTTSGTYAVNFLGRDGPGGADHYQVTLDWGASFFGIATISMPLLPPLEAVQIVTEGYNLSFPDRRPEQIRPGDTFEFFVPAGTLVCDRWRRLSGAVEYRSLRGDNLTIYTDYRSLVLHRLVRAESPNLVEVSINHGANLKDYDLARELFGQGDSDFQPDFLQVAQARDVIQNQRAEVKVDLTRPHLDDFWGIRDSSEPGGKTEEGLEIHWFRSDQVAQPLFRVDNGIGDRRDPASVPSPMRIYYYKDGTVRTFQRAEELTFVRARQPRNDTWARVYSEYGRLQQPPSRWELGQPEQDEAAQEMRRLGVAVLRFEPKAAPKGNFFTRFLDMLMGMMNRKSPSA